MIFTESEKVSCTVVSYSLWSYGLYPTGLLCPWNSPGKCTGVGCHFLLQGIFLTQGSNLDLRHCRQILYYWATSETLSLYMYIEIHTHICITYIHIHIHTLFSLTQSICWIHHCMVEYLLLKNKMSLSKIINFSITDY